jgi:hypothetical protein
MTTSRKMRRNSPPSSVKAISLRERAMNRQRQRNRLYEFVIRTLERECEAKKLRRIDLAAMLDKEPSQITRWLSGPSNWEFDTVSDLLFSLGGELQPQFKSFDEYMNNRSNFAHELSHSPNQIHEETSTIPAARVIKAAVPSAQDAETYAY